MYLLASPARQHFPGWWPGTFGGVGFGGRPPVGCCGLPRPAYWALDAAQAGESRMNVGSLVIRVNALFHCHLDMRESLARVLRESCESFARVCCCSRPNGMCLYIHMSTPIHARTVQPYPRRGSCAVDGWRGREMGECECTAYLSRRPHSARVGDDAAKHWRPSEAELVRYL
jgi:hypothetical protein